MAAHRLSQRLGIELDAADALLVAADGDEDTAVAVYVGYNEGDASILASIDEATQREVDKKLAVLSPFLSNGGALVIDGGLATELEKRGANLADDLWSARLLRDDPALIGEVHKDYFRHGADVGISASYQVKTYIEY